MLLVIKYKERTKENVENRENGLIQSQDVYVKSHSPMVRKICLFVI